MSTYHVSVLLQEAVEALNVQKDKKYIDATFGGGGHAGEIINKGGVLLGIDTDGDAIENAKENFKFHPPAGGSKLILAKGNFKDIDTIAYENGFEMVSGILFDLGVSSHQLDTSDRGFSFSKNAPLDMRMDSVLTVTAADLVNGLNKGELQELFLKLGEESFARKIANNIIEKREVKRIETTSELAEIIVKSYPRGATKVHPATKVFQALRIAVNDELNSLRDSLPKAISLLEKGGRLIIISFHSLEDRIIKKAFENFENEGKGAIVTVKPIIPTEQETFENRRARSAKLRIFEKN